ncbi:MAG TPA: CPBP family glutamic-type intramembrane protease, partial [Isosphaeraceae bacterium]|nr:CPBP family glutamic-type intramembrane protease [Isosphaeraceae bacterium]
AALITSALFALAHPEWLPALLTGLLWAGLLWWSRSVLACVLSHATANLGLGLYVLATGEWSYL